MRSVTSQISEYDDDNDDEDGGRVPHNFEQQTLNCKLSPDFVTLQFSAPKRHFNRKCNFSGRWHTAFQGPSPGGRVIPLPTHHPCPQPSLLDTPLCPAGFTSPMPAFESVWHVTTSSDAAYDLRQHATIHRTSRDQKARSNDLLKPNSITLAGSKLVADLQRAEIWPII